MAIHRRGRSRRFMVLPSEREMPLAIDRCPDCGGASPGVPLRVGSNPRVPALRRRRRISIWTDAVEPVPFLRRSPDRRQMVVVLPPRRAELIVLLGFASIHPFICVASTSTTRRTTSHFIAQKQSRRDQTLLVFNRVGFLCGGRSGASGPPTAQASD